MSTICYKVIQMHDPPETTELMTFVRTVETRSISRAALELGVPRPTVGRRLARLEQKLGVRLLRRTTRAMTLTDAGELLYARARVVLAAVADVEESVRSSDDTVRGLLRISTPPFQNASGLGGLVASFLERYPDVRVEIDASTRYVDLVSGGFDVAIRASSAIAPGLIARNLMRSRVVALASPAYLARTGVPTRVTDLKKHALLVGFERGEHPVTHWPLAGGGRLRIAPSLASNDLTVLREAALRGRGIALLPIMLVYDDVVAGALTPVLPERIGIETVLAVVYADREFVSPAVRAFVDAVVQWAREDPALSRPMPVCKPALRQRTKKR